MPTDDDAPAPTAPAGWLGWAAQSVASPAAPAGWLGWAAQSAASPAAPAGWLGWAAQGAASGAAPAGWLGWAAQAPLNLRVVVLLPPTQAPTDTYVPLTLTLSSAPTGPGPAEQQVLPYAAPGVLALSAPPEVPLTLALASPRYEASSQPLLLAAGQELTLTLQLAFRAGRRPATKVRRHYRPG